MSNSRMGFLDISGSIWDDEGGIDLDDEVNKLYGEVMDEIDGVKYYAKDDYSAGGFGDPYEDDGEVMGITPCSVVELGDKLFFKTHTLVPSSRMSRVKGRGKFKLVVARTIVIDI